MAGACRSWRARLAKPPLPPPQLPWLVLPSGGSTRFYCVLSGCVHHYETNAPPHGARCFGSQEGAWLFLAFNQNTDHELVNLRADRALLIPDKYHPQEDDPLADGHDDTAILAATISSPLDGPGCVAAGIVAYQRAIDGPLQRRCAFWPVGDEVAYGTPPQCTEAMEDVLYRDDGFFHFLTSEEHILACAPTFSPIGDDQLRRVALSSTLRCCVPRDGRDHEGNVRARYLLESRGELLMVVRFAPDHDSPTSGFKVFSRIGPLPLKDDGSGGMVGHPYRWRELDTLGGRMLFLGRGCSRSYETAEYPGFEDGIYFLDDRSFYDEQIMFRGVGERQYPFSDNGKWTQGPPPNVELFFPDQVPSNHSSPAWLLPEIERRCWEDLLPEIVADIAARLPCPAAEYRLSKVCPEWRAALLLPRGPRRPHLPCLLLPYSKNRMGAERTESVGCIQCGCFARLIGSYEGGWVFAALEQKEKHALINFSQGHDFIALPDICLQLDGCQKMDAMLIRAATLSSPPVPLQGCIAGVIVSRPPRPRTQVPELITFWLMGNQLATCSRDVPEKAEDLIYFQKSFFFLTAQKNLILCTPDVQAGDHLRVQQQDLQFKPLVDEDEANSVFPEFTVSGRYLVESRRELLMVVRIQTGESYTSPTSSFRVFRMTKQHSSSKYLYSWDELLELEGRMLFIGRGCSRSFEITDYTGCVEGVYFHDDNQFRATAMVWEMGIDDWIPRRYMGSDNGICTALPDVVHHLYPGLAPSCYSAPIWCLK